MHEVVREREIPDERWKGGKCVHSLARRGKRNKLNKSSEVVMNLEKLVNPRKVDWGLARFVQFVYLFEICVSFI